MTPGPYTVDLAKLDDVANRMKGFAGYLADYLDELDPQGRRPALEQLGWHRRRRSR
jgi:hypothetical protein